VICVIYGTTGELIKLAPVLVRIRNGGGEYMSATTGQQVQQIPGLLDELSLPRPDIWLGRGFRGRDLHANRDIPRWLAEVLAGFARRRAQLRGRLRAGAGAPLVLVHGDTITTVLGTLMGRVLRVPVAHIEAGVRTWDIFHPFPEELNRRLVSRIAQLHYAPGPAAAANLRRGIVVDTGTNTIRDSVHLAPRNSPVPAIVEGSRYSIVSLHRYELLRDRALLEQTLATLATHARRTPMLFVDHPVTATALRRFRLDHYFDDEHFIRMERLSFFGFVELLRRSAYIVTDSGGTQVESFELDIPCLVHRKKVEQPEGVGENVVVSGFSTSALEAFLREPERHRRQSPHAGISPSDLIVSDLRRRGYLATP
jgi:UDP-N-acetylglucosamine 2-epimerase (non-hydrolysing)